MNELCRKKKVVTLRKKKKIKERAPKKKVDKKCKKKHDMKSSYNMEEDIRYFTANEKKNMMEYKECDLVLMPENEKNCLFV